MVRTDAVKLYCASTSDAQHVELAMLALIDFPEVQVRSWHLQERLLGINRSENTVFALIDACDENDLKLLKTIPGIKLAEPHGHCVFPCLVDHRLALQASLQGLGRVVAA